MTNVEEGVAQWRGSHRGGGRTEEGVAQRRGSYQGGGRGSGGEERPLGGRLLRAGAPYRARGSA